MHRLTARILLVLSFVGMFMPAAMAVSAPSPHACCLRKTQHRHSPQDRLVRAANCANHDCCRPAAMATWAQTTAQYHFYVLLPSTSCHLDSGLDVRITRVDIARSVRAPPFPASA